MSFAGLGIAATGLFVLLASIVKFARRGRGTLSPLDPPDRLVVAGLYRRVRNPMYLGVLLLLLGEAMLDRSGAIAIYTAGFFVAANVFIIAYEEPTLQRSFGSAYTEYRKNVRRWIPRRTPWSPALK